MPKDTNKSQENVPYKAVRFYPKRIYAPQQSNGLLSLCHTFVRMLSEHNCLLHFLKTYNNLTCRHNTAGSTRDAA